MTKSDEDIKLIILSMPARRSLGKVWVEGPSAVIVHQKMKILRQAQDDCIFCFQVCFRNRSTTNQENHMKLRRYIVPILTFITLTHANPWNLPAKLQSLYQAVITYGQKHLPEQRVAVIQELRKAPCPQVCKHPELLYNAAEHLTQCPTVDHQLITHKELINTSIAQFKDQPGYPITLHTLLARHEEESFYKGYTYELHVARMLYMRYGIKVTAFGVYVRNAQGLVRQFDLQTPHSFIECKNIHWPRRDICDIATLDQQFMDQRRLICDLNAYQKAMYTYEVCSNYPIPDDWRQFFTQHCIATRHIGMP